MKRTLGNVIGPPWPITSVRLGPLLRAWTTFLLSREVTKTWKMPKGVWGDEKSRREAQLGKYPAEHRQSYCLKNNTLYLGNVKLLASRNFTKPLLFPGLQEALTSCWSVSQPSTFENIPSRFPSVSWVTSVCLSTLPGGSCAYNFPIVICNQPQSPWLFLLIIY